MKDLEKCRELLDLIKELGMYTDAIRGRLCEPYNITPVQAIVLNDVYHNEGTRVTKICERLCKSTNTISPLINRLISFGYLEKIQDKEDKRVVFVYTTPKAKELLVRLLKDVDEYSYPFFDKISVSQFNKYYDSLHTLNQLLKEEFK